MINRYNAQKELLRAGGSILALAGAMARLRSKLNEKASDNAKKGYEKAANTKKENKELTKKNIEQVIEKKAPQSFGELAGVEETFKQADAPAEKEVVKAKKPVQGFGALAAEEAPAPKQKYILSEEGAYFPIKAENTETKIPVDEDVKGLIEVKQKNALRAAASKRGQEKYQKIKERLTYRFADEHNIDDVWRNISLDPNITDEMIKKAGFTKTKILQEWKWYNDNPTDWMEMQDIRGEEYGVVGGIAEAEEGSNFGRMLSAYIKAKVEGKTLAQQQEEYDLSKAEEEPEEENYKVWQDEIKNNRNFDGIVF